MFERLKAWLSGRPKKRVRDSDAEAHRQAMKRHLFGCDRRWIQRTGAAVRHEAVQARRVAEEAAPPQRDDLDFLGGVALALSEASAADRGSPTREDAYAGTPAPAYEPPAASSWDPPTSSDTGNYSGGGGDYGGGGGGGDFGGGGSSGEW